MEPYIIEFYTNFRIFERQLIVIYQGIHQGDMIRFFFHKNTHNSLDSNLLRGRFLMKKTLYILILSLITVVLAACDQNDLSDQPNENELVNETEDQVEENNKEDDTNQHEESDVEDENEQSPEHDGTPLNEEQVYENKMFKEVKVSETENEFIITGKVQVFEGVFDYALFDGKEKILEDHYQTVGAPAWGDFEIPIDKETIANAKNEARLELFAYSAKDGSKENVLNIQLTTR